MELEGVDVNEDSLHLELAEISSLLAKKYEEDGNYEKAFYYSEKTAYYKECIFKKQNIKSLFTQKEDTDKGKVLEYQRLCTKMDEVSTICRNIASNFDFKKMIKNLYEDIKRVVKLDILSIGICNEAVDFIERYVYVEGKEVLELDSYTLSNRDTFGGYCLKNKRSILVGDVSKEYDLYAPEFIFKEDNPLSYIYIPMEFRGKIRGFFSVQSYRKYNYNRDDVYKLRVITEYLAIAMENSKYYNEVKYMASHDYLTGLLNRKELIGIGQKEFQKFKSKTQILSVIIMDVDNFKKINDRYGHITGDQVIVSIGKIIMQNVRKSDYAGRCGGEEFIIILPKTTQKVAYEVAERIRKKIEKTELMVYGYKVRVTSSFGVFEFCDDIKSFEQGSSKADKAMYMAKKTGKNKVCCIL